MAWQVLIIDDDPVDAQACRRALTRGLQPPPRLDIAATGAEALALAAERDHDCVLLDVRLPDMDGLEVLRRLQGLRPQSPSPVVMLNGADDAELAVRAMRLGASDYLVKDVEGAYQAPLPSVVERAVRSRELQREKLRTEQALERYRQQLQQLAHQLIAQEKAMNRHLAQSLHDRLGQTLAALRLSFDALRASSAWRQGEAPRGLADRVDTLIDQAVREVRSVLVELRPPRLEDNGLMAALDNELRERQREPAPGTVPRLRLRAAPGVERHRWPADVEYAAFMVAREAVSNALRHAGARTIQVDVQGDDQRLRLSVTDDGRGIDDAALGGKPGHLGMVGMRERAQAIGARFDVRRLSPADGTAVTLEWPAP